MRFDKPIGTFLLLAPTLWGVVLANEGYPSLRLLAIFLVGAVIMRAAGCIANDLADRNLDGHVERTRLRPLVTGALTVKEAFALLLLLLAVALGLVALTNPAHHAAVYRWCSAGNGVSADEARYPLATGGAGLAFSWSIPMHLRPAPTPSPRRCGGCLRLTCYGRWSTTPNTRWLIVRMTCRSASSPPRFCSVILMCVSSASPVLLPDRVLAMRRRL